LRSAFPLLPKRTPSGSLRISLPAALAVLTLHLAAVAPLLLRANFRHHVQSSQKLSVVTASFVVAEDLALDTVPVPEVTPPRVRFESLERVRFESVDWGDISNITAPASAPTLSRFQPVDPAVFARLAGLRAGQVASVVLTVEVLPDGTVGSVEVTRGMGDSAVDAAAVAYVRHLRWIPGTREHHAEAMRISLPVTLVWNA
jgi:TonB family protein